MRLHVEFDVYIDYRSKSGRLSAKSFNFSLIKRHR